MNFLHAILLGIVEGLTEFLPISSTLHLIQATKQLGLEETPFIKLFNVVIQSGAMLAVVPLFLRTLFNDRTLFKKIALSFIPTAAVGFAFYKVIKSFFFVNQSLQWGVFLSVGFLFIGYEWVMKERPLQRDASSLSHREAIFIGIAQALAVVPGVSRSGIVMLAMMGMGMKRPEAARYSFFLAVPTIFAASVFDLFKNREAIIGQTHHAEFLLIGLFSSFVSAMFVIRWFIGYLQKHSLAPFGWYRIVLSLFFLIP